MRGHWLILSQAGDGFRLFDYDGTRHGEITTPAAGAQARAGEIVQALKGAASMQRRRPPLALRLAPDLVFARRLRLPAAALGDAARIALLDLEQTTPFRAGDVLAQTRVVSGAGVAGEAEIEQIVVKRRALEAADRLLGECGRQADRIDVWAGPVGEGVGLPAAIDIDLRPQPRASSKGAVPGAVPALAASAAVLAIAAVGIAVYRLETALATAAAETAALRTRHSALMQERQETELRGRDVGRLILARARQPSVPELIERLTRMLPDTDHLTALRVRGRTIEMTGFAASSASLLLAMEQSGWLEKAALTSAAVFDETAGRERFSLRAEVKPQPNGEAATAEVMGK